MVSSSSLAKIRLVAFNDVYELANLPRLQTFLKKLDRKPSAVILAGDFLSPSTLSSIDGGRGMVSTLRASGLTHAILGNHEQVRVRFAASSQILAFQCKTLWDLKLDTLQKRLQELSKSVQVVNSNIRGETLLMNKHGSSSTWMTSITKPYSIIPSPCGRVKLALLGLMSDEPGIFRDNTFKGIPIADIMNTYIEGHQELVPHKAGFILPVTHQSLFRDRELAEHMLQVNSSLERQQPHGLIIGGHDHEPYDETVETDTISASGGSTVRILKTGMDANNVSLIDLSFDVDNELAIPSLVNVESELVALSSVEPSVVVQNIVNEHMSVVAALDTENIIDSVDDVVGSCTSSSQPLCSVRTRFEQTTVGAAFCQMIKEELNADVAILNGATLKGDKTYEQGQMSYSELKRELPFPTKMVVVCMKRSELEDSIQYSRTNNETGSDSDGETPRRGFLQVDRDYWEQAPTGLQKGQLLVAVPRNLLNGFCKILPLLRVGDNLRKAGRFPTDDDFVPAIDLVVRYASKSRWQTIAANIDCFKEYDGNQDGTLDRNELKLLLSRYLGHEPADFVVEDMISCIDTNGDGYVDRGELRLVLAAMERDSIQFQRSSPQNNSLGI